MYQLTFYYQIEKFKITTFYFEISIKEGCPNIFWTPSKNFLNNYQMKILLFILILSSISCTEETLTKGKNILIKEFPQESKLIGEKLEINSIGINNIYVVDTFFICFKANGLDDFFDIYSTNTYQSLGKYLSPGRGPNEYLNAIFNGQSFQDSLNTYMWINDCA